MAYRTKQNGMIDKPYYRSLSREGFDWGGHVDGFHFFVRRTLDHLNLPLYEEINVTDDDIENGNLDYFIQHGLTR